MPGPTEGQLVHVADQEQPRVIRNRLQDLVHQHDIHHRGLVDDHEIGFQRILGIALEAEGLEIKFEQAMHGLGLQASDSRFAARPVGAQRLTWIRLARRILRMLLTMVVFSTPGETSEGGVPV